MGIITATGPIWTPWLWSQVQVVTSSLDQPCSLNVRRVREGALSEGTIAAMKPTRNPGLA